MQIPVVYCLEADQEHKSSQRHYAHVFHKLGKICIAHAFWRLPETHALAILLHECGHILAGPDGGEQQANRTIEDQTGIPIFWKDSAAGESLEWIRPQDRKRAREALGLRRG